MAAPSIDADDEFDEYNPHPYQGGYDIALTYGHPLPPSASTCYPISQGSAHLPKPIPPYPPPEFGHHTVPSPPLPLHPPPSESDHPPELLTPLPLPPPSESDHCPEPLTPLPLPPPPSESDHRPEPLTPLPLPPPESDHHPEPLPTHLESIHRPEYDYRPVSYWPWPDFDNFGFWPDRTKECERCCADVDGVGYWHQLKRAGDYLFGYSEGYGERRIGVDSYGIPIYANKKEDSVAVTVEIEPARDLKVECYESGNSSGNWFSSYNESNDRSYGYTYNKHYYEEPLHAQENLTEPMLHQQLTYHEAYEEQVYPKLEWWPSSYEEEDRSYGYAYNKHHHKESLHVEENLVEPMLDQRLAYHEHPSYGEHDDETKFYGNSQYAYERRDKEQPLCVELEPYKPIWSQNLHYVEFYGGESSLAYNSHSSMDNVVEDETSIFGESNGAHGRNSYEQPVCVQLEPYKSTWAQNPTFYESYGQEVSQSSWVDYSKENGAQNFSSLFEYSQYDE